MMTRAETLRGQLANSLLRLAELQRRAERATSREALLPRAFDELQRTLAELEVAVEELRDQNFRLETAQSEVESERSRWEALFERAPLPYVLTDLQGVICHVNGGGASLLAVSRRFLVDKALSIFVDGGRSAFLEQVASAARANGEPVTIEFTLRPRERAPVQARASVHRFMLPDGGPGLWWVFEKHQGFPS